MIHDDSRDRTIPALAKEMARSGTNLGPTNVNRTIISREDTVEISQILATSFVSMNVTMNNRMNGTLRYAGIAKRIVMATDESSLRCQVPETFSTGLKSSLPIS
jgi:hypothetical protein